MSTARNEIDPDMDAHAAAVEGEVGYAWEARYKRSWDEVQEDANGVLSTSAWRLQEQLKRRKHKHERHVRRGIIRHVFVIVDLSTAMDDKEFKPTYMEVAVAYLKQFVVEFFDQNPIAQLGFIGTKDGLATKLSELSGNLAEHLRALDDVKDPNLCKGEPSIQNALTLGRASLSHVPAHGSKELIFVMAALTSRDPGDIQSTVAKVHADKIRVSAVGLAAEVQLCRNICKETGGTYRVALDQDHAKDCLWEMIPPPPLTADNSSTDLILFGFPLRSHQKFASLCACHSTPSTEGYHCPRCLAKLCTIPTDCVVCGLKLISSPHLARSYHHLFPVEPFDDVTRDDLDLPAVDYAMASSNATASVLAKHCFACNTAFAAAALAVTVTPPRNLTAPASPARVRLKLTTTTSDIQSRRFECTRCRRSFCYDCDIFIHEVLHNCPGC